MNANDLAERHKSTTVEVAVLNSPSAEATTGCRRPNFELPGVPGDVHVVPVSGGADSTYTAILMTRLFPDIEMHLIFTDTGVESSETYVALERLEVYLGRRITRLRGATLYDLTRKYSGFLPSPGQRYCTRELKLVPFHAYLDKFAGTGRRVHCYVGIRADEPLRAGLVSHQDWIETHLPLKALGIDREAVFRGLADTVGVPEIYKTRSRSGCGVCFFQRRAEIIGFLQQSPSDFEEARSYEKLSPEDQDRHPTNANSVQGQTGLGLNWRSLPVPARVDVRTEEKASPVIWGRQRNRNANADLFDRERYATLWVGAEFFVEPNLGGTGVWWQRLVTWSSRRSGLEQQLDALWQHRLATPEVFHMDVAQMRAELRFAIYLLQVPESLMDVVGPSALSFTWQHGQSLAQVKHLHAWCTRVLQLAQLDRELQEYRDASPMSVRFEWYESTRKALSRVVGERGRLLSMDRYLPVESATEEDERFVPCFICSL